jgi:hypothetical protein
MASYLRRFGTKLAFLGFAAILPATVGAQAPVCLTQWGSSFPAGVATNAAGNGRIQKFTSTGTYLAQWGQCIDYGDYLHFVGSVDTPGNTFGVAVSGTPTARTAGPVSR